MSGLLTDFLITLSIVGCIAALTATFLVEQQRHTARFTSQQKRFIHAELGTCTIIGVQQNRSLLKCNWRAQNEGIILLGES